MPKTLRLAISNFGKSLLIRSLYKQTKVKQKIGYKLLLSGNVKIFFTVLTNPTHTLYSIFTIH